MVLNAHEHVYERFAPQNPDGVADPANGIRQFTVGTGGVSHAKFPSANRVANSQVSNDATFGILTLALHAGLLRLELSPGGGQDLHRRLSHLDVMPLTRRTPSRSRRGRPAALLLALAAVCGLVASSAPAGRASAGPSRGKQPTVHVAKGDPVIAAAGNIACDPANTAFNAGNGSATACHMKVVSNLLLGPDGATPRYRTVLALGDTQYTCGGLAAFQQSYGPTWGRVFSVTKPVVGDKDYRTTANAPGRHGVLRTRPEARTASSPTSRR